MILIIDNYDSFTYNLVQQVGTLIPDHPIQVVRNDQATLAELDSLNPSRVIISPGPCTPNEAGISNDVIKHYAGKIPILGVCLGHQCIGQVFGGTIQREKRLMHGKTSAIKHVGTGCYEGLPNPFIATRYHSLTISRDSLPEDFEVTAWTDDRDELMGIRHKTMPIEGVQFHPESFLTVEGSQLMANFLGLSNQPSRGL